MDKLASKVGLLDWDARRMPFTKALDFTESSFLRYWREHSDTPSRVRRSFPGAVARFSPWGSGQSPLVEVVMVDKLHRS